MTLAVTSTPSSAAVTSSASTHQQQFPSSSFSPSFVAALAPDAQQQDHHIVCIDVFTHDQATLPSIDNPKGNNTTYVFSSPHPPSPTSNSRKSFQPRKSQSTSSLLQLSAVTASNVTSGLNIFSSPFKSSPQQQQTPNNTTHHSPTPLSVATVSNNNDISNTYTTPTTASNINNKPTFSSPFPAPVQQQQQPSAPSSPALTSCSTVSTIASPSTATPSPLAFLQNHTLHQQQQQQYIYPARNSSTTASLVSTSLAATSSSSQLPSSSPWFFTQKQQPTPLSSSPQPVMSAHLSTTPSTKTEMSRIGQVPQPSPPTFQSPNTYIDPSQQQHQLPAATTPTTPTLNKKSSLQSMSDACYSAVSRIPSLPDLSGLSGSVGSWGLPGFGKRKGSDLPT